VTSARINDDHHGDHDNPDARQQAQAALRPGERLLWAGRGDPKVIFSPKDAYLIPFSIAWCGFVAFWLYGAISSGAPPFFPIFGSLFALIGVMLLVGRFFLKAARRRRTVYAVTDQRAFLATGRRVVQTDSHRADRETHRSRDGRHLSVVWTTHSASYGMFFPSTNVWADTGFDGILTPLPMAFYAVTDGDALLAALDQAWRTGLDRAR
jgi:hypothetical protein